MTEAVTVPTVGLLSAPALPFALVAFAVTGIFVALAIWARDVLDRGSIAALGLVIALFGAGSWVWATSVDRDALTEDLEAHYGVAVRPSSVEDLPDKGLDTATIDIEAGPDTFREVTLVVDDGEARLFEDVDGRRVELGA